MNNIIRSVEVYAQLNLYPQTLDGMNQAFEDYGLTYKLEKGINKETGELGYFASNSHGGERFSNNPAKAMFYLFMHSME